MTSHSLMRSPSRIAMFCNVGVILVLDAECVCLMSSSLNQYMDQVIIKLNVLKTTNV